MVDPPKPMEQEESPPVEVVGKYFLAKTLRDSGGETTLNTIYS
jgi:hypothetical protein